MQIRILARTAVVFCAVLATAGCQYSPDAVDRTIAFNRSVAQSDNQQILLNAVRASRRAPTFYARLGSDTTSSTIAPGLSASIPWSGTKSVTQTVTKTLTTPASTSIATALGKAVPSLTPGLTITEQNQLTLTSLDDQGSVTGMMTPVSMQYYQYFQNEGFNREELLLMFLGSISLSEEQLQEISDLASDKCDAISLRPKNIWCERIKGKAFKDAMPHCKDQLYGKSDPDMSAENQAARAEKKLFFANDPAQDDSMKCFQDIERTLLALGLHPDSATDHKVLYRLPLETIKGNPRYLADLNQQNLEVAILYTDKAKGHEVAVCKKTDSPLLQFSDPIKKILREATAAEAKANKAKATSGKRADKKKNKSGAVPSTAVDPDLKNAVEMARKVLYLLSPVSRSDATAGPNKELVSLLGTNLPASCEAAATAKDEEKEDPDASSDGTADKKDDVKPTPISFTQRSFEAMVYYLGQIIRRSDALKIPTAIYFASNATREEELFRVVAGTPPDNAVVAVESEGQTYYVPSICESDTACTEAEFPKHASPQILTLLNQIWGLEKTATAPPAVSNVTVITPP